MAEKKLLEQMADKIAALHYSPKTREAYVEWARKYILFHGKRHPREPDACPECGEEYSSACGKCAVGHERG